MYTPMKFTEKVDHSITVKGFPKVSSDVNLRSSAFVKEMLSKDRASFIGRTCVGYSDFLREGINEDVYNLKELESAYSKSLGYRLGFQEDDCFADMLNRIVSSEWSKTKRVYKMDRSLMDTLITMDNMKFVPTDTFVKLPCKSFYIDFNGNDAFGKYCVGMFVTYDVWQGNAYYALNTVCEGGYKLGQLTTVISLPSVGEINEYDECVMDVDKCLSNFRDSVSLSCEFDIIKFREKDMIKFFINLCCYFRASNSVVEYTERTRQIYKPRKSGQTPKNQMREVEEFGVGFRNGTAISTNKKVVRYVGDKPDKSPSNVKRKYAGGMRVAHWHHYWVKTESGKEKVLKWVEATFVHGNYGSNSIVVQEVK